MTQVAFRRQGRRQATAYILSQAINVINQSGHIMFSDIGQQGIDKICARGCLVAFGRTSDRTGIQRFCQMNHFIDFFLDMGRFAITAIVGHGRCRTDDDV